MQKKTRLKVINNKYIGTGILGKDPTIPTEDIDFWNEAMKTMCEDIRKPELLEKLTFKTNQNQHTNLKKI